MNLVLLIFLFVKGKMAEREIIEIVLDSLRKKK